MQTFDIYVFIPTLNRTLYAHTYECADESAPEQVKESYVANNPHRNPDEVIVSRRSEQVQA